jgi:CDP-glycerol glycerophosphotransferase (TagB/SpsB family)
MIADRNATAVSDLQARLRATLVRAAFALARLLPLQPRVVLATAHADRIGGNLEYIRDALARHEPAIPVTVLASRPRGGSRGSVEAVFDALVAGYHLATARVFIVDDFYFPAYVVRPRSGSALIQVWHASGAFKKFGYSVLDKSFGADHGAVGRTPIHTNYDLCLVSAMKFAPFYAEAFHQPLQRFTSRFGIPRTDLFFDPDQIADTAATIRRRYQIPAGRRVILYAPTFRGERITEARSPDQLDLGILKVRLGDDHIVLVRRHPFVRHELRLGPDLRGFAIDVSDHPDINELMLVSDVLVTDYSSAIYEFSLLERPIAFFAPDHAAYEHERGFYLEYSTDLPGPVFETTEALADYLRAGAYDTDRVRRFRADSFDVADGRSSDRVIEEVILPALAGPAR